MKKYSIIFALLAVYVMSYGATDPDAESQDIFLSRSFRWDVENSVEDGIHYTTSITIGKDTIINEQTYRLVDNYYPMRQTKDCIYMYDYSTKKEVLLYDFSLQVGDIIEQLPDPFSGYPARNAKVIKTDTIILADGRKARRIEYEKQFPAPRSVDVEYVGTETGGILGVLDNTIRESHLVAFYDNNILLYPFSEYLAAPNSPSFSDKIFQDGHIIIHRNGKTYTVTGQEVK